MYTIKDLQKQLEDMGLKHTDAVMIHSSMKAIGDVENRADGVIDALMDYFKDGLLMLPTHTWAYMDAENTLFDAVNQESCVGILTNVFRKRANVVRSLHPTHSIAAFGPNAKEYVANEENVGTPAAPEGVWGRLPSVNAKIMLIGCNHIRNTFIHSVEEMLDIPNRIAKEGIEFTLKNDEVEVKRVFHKHHSEGMPHLSENYQKAAELFKNKGIVTEHKFGDATVLLMDTTELMLFVKDMLAIDRDVFSFRDALDTEKFIHLESKIK